MSNQIKKTIVLSGHNTSIALEKEFWLQLKRIASKGNLKLDDLIQKINHLQYIGYRSFQFHYTNAIYDTDTVLDLHIFH